MSDHPIPIGRRFALNDSDFWRPLKGTVKAIVESFSLEPETAGSILAEGLFNGTIAHQHADPASHYWVVTPRSADLVLKAIRSHYGQPAHAKFEDYFDLREGVLRLPWGEPKEVQVFWPDIKRAVESSASFHAPILDGSEKAARKRGPKGGLTDKIASALLADLESGAITVQKFELGKKEAFCVQYGAGSRDTLMKAWEKAITQHRSEFDNSTRDK